MCIAILNKGKMLSYDTLQNCWNNNDDGAGMLYLSNGNLIAEKFPNENLMKSQERFDEFYQRYCDTFSQYGNAPMLLHFRIATHGKTPEYLHPFMVSDHVGLIHNGVIPGFGSEKFSDTSEFADMLSTITFPNVGTLDNWFISEAIQKFIGATNKLVFLDSYGEFRIFNEKLGEWVDGSWFSNDSHRNAVRYHGSVAETDMDYGFMYPDYEVAPTANKYYCPCCKENVDVSYNAECVECYTYIDAAVGECLTLMDSEEYKDLEREYNNSFKKYGYKDDWF